VGFFILISALKNEMRTAKKLETVAAQYIVPTLAAFLFPIVTKSFKERIMSNILSEVLQANSNYSSSFGEKSKLAMPPARRFAILTCMDARLDPAKFAGLSEGDAHVIRNAGGRASDDAIRSLVISYKLLGTREFFVIHHTNCGMEFFTNDVMRDLLASSLDTAELTPQGFRDVGKTPGSHAGEYIEWLTIKNQKQAIVDDVARIRAHALVPKSIPVYGYLYDVSTGKLQEVEGARAAGAAA
jgi:carbonic anhydrase